MNKKATKITLSSIAIVILILALTFVGFGIYFNNKVFGKAIATLDETMQKEVGFQMEQSNNIVELSNPVYNIKPNEKKIIYLGYKNKESSPLIFTITTVETTSLSNKVNNCGLDKNIDKTIVEYKKTDTLVKEGSTLVLPINIITKKDAEQDTCLYEFNINIKNSEIDSTEKVQLTIEVK